MTETEFLRYLRRYHDGVDAETARLIQELRYKYLPMGEAADLELAEAMAAR